MSEVTVNVEPVEPVVHGYTINVTPAEAEAMYAVLTGAERPYRVRQANPAIYGVIDALRKALPEAGR